MILSDSPPPLLTFSHRSSSPDWENFILPASSTSLAFPSLTGLCQQPTVSPYPQAWRHPLSYLTSQGAVCQGEAG